LKVLVTGAKGMLGTDIVKYLSDEHEVAGVDINDFDIANIEITLARVLQIAPDIIIHAAAYTDVDGCELDIDTAYRVNAIGTQSIALACQNLDIPLLYISTDFVFDGKKRTPYLEWDTPNPIAVYGASKYAGEQIVTGLLNKFYIVRIAWLYGQNGKNFVYTIRRLAGERDKLQIVDDQIGSPTFTTDVAGGIGRLIKMGNYGIYHMVNHGEVSWYGFAKEILRLSGLNGVKVEPVSSDILNRAAKRPSYSVLRNLALELTIGDSMRNWDSALTDFIDRIDNKKGSNK
jgi:dTDP-4-dehydrorhamnose reductase